MEGQWWNLNCQNLLCGDMRSERRFRSNPKSLEMILWLRAKMVLALESPDHTQQQEITMLRRMQVVSGFPR
jgi:hypothetical protein